jgi:N-acetyl-anhydromuramyl-L-alanine amidase AmpD
VIDFDGYTTCHADLQATAAYHAGAVNSRSVGIEIYQGSNAELYAGQLDAVVTIVDWLTKRFGIQRGIPAGYQGAPVTRLELGARDFVGVFGHRDCSSNRGKGDPGDEVFRLLAAAGYERWDIEAQQDLTAWKSRQLQLGLFADGVPGPLTVAALVKAGRPGGMWVRRPGDAPNVA